MTFKDIVFVKNEQQSTVESRTFQKCWRFLPQSSCKISHFWFTLLQFYLFCYLIHTCLRHYMVHFCALNLLNREYSASCGWSKALGRACWSPSQGPVGNYLPYLLGKGGWRCSVSSTGIRYCRKGISWFLLWCRRRPYMAEWCILPRNWRSTGELPFVGMDPQSRM